MAEQGSLRTQKNYSEKREDTSVKENLSIEKLKEGEECPNCHFAHLVREDNQILCPICCYGRKACT
jgi:hypothetical protein